MTPPDPVATTPLPAPEEHRFPCPQCGADYRFDPQRGQLVCDHCGHVDEIDPPGPWARSIRELDFDTALRDGLKTAEMMEIRVLQCPDCGARVELDAATHATECPFCATPVVTDTGLYRQIKPRGVLPFKLDERAARRAMTDWLGRLWFAPGGLRDDARKGRRMQGIYLPCWTFDADTESLYRGERGTVSHEIRTVMRNGKPTRVRVRKLRWHPVSGRVARLFDDVLVPASRSLPKRHADALEPWDLAELEPYRPEFLAGFRAEAYRVSLDEGFSEARKKMEKVIARDVRFDIGGDRQRIHDIETTLRNVTFKHILLPVWLAAYRYRGKTYRFVVNGQTGRVEGERPWSVWKIAFAVLAGLIVAGTLGYAIALSQGAM